MYKIKILIVDDHTLVREGIAALLKLYDDVEVIGQAKDGKEAIEKTPQLRPDVILMDIAMPGLGGLEATVAIKKTLPQTKILVLSQYDDKEYVSRFLKAGAAGYILKKALGSELITAIRAVAKGESYLHSSVTTGIIEDYLRKEVPQTDDLYGTLTDREKQIIKLIAEGNTHKEIANLLGISAKTAAAHQTNISEKLDLHSKTDLIKFAISKGIIKLDV